MAQRDLTRYQKQVQALEDDLDRAVARNKDAIARMLIRKLHPLRQCVVNLEAQIRQYADELAELRERLAAQTMTYEDIRHRVAALRERSRTASGLSGAFSSEVVPGSSEPSEEEIEWELLQRKEATGAGRTP